MQSVQAVRPTTDDDDLIKPGPLRFNQPRE